MALDKISDSDTNDSCHIQDTNSSDSTSTISSIVSEIAPVLNTEILTSPSSSTTSTSSSLSCSPIAVVSTKSDNNNCDETINPSTNSLVPLMGMKLHEVDSISKGFHKDLVIVPRTVPCIVLTSSTSTFNNNETSVISKLESTFANNEPSTKKSDNVPKKLSFGIDRILGEDSNKTDEEVSKQSKQQPAYTTSSTNNDVHHNHHQHQHSSYMNLSQCSECFLLSRYYRNATMMQFPVQSSASSPYSWVTNHFDGNSILSPSGYSHQQTSSLSSSYALGGTNFSTMSSMVSCTTGGSGRRKRSWSRAVFSNLQRKGLEKRFQIQKYITKPDRRQLAATLGLTDAQVKVWFQNRRMKWRHSKEGKILGSNCLNEDEAPLKATIFSPIFGDKK